MPSNVKKIKVKIEVTAVNVSHRRHIEVTAVNVSHRRHWERYRFDFKVNKIS